jgi:hypothetical protein
MKFFTRAVGGVAMLLLVSAALARPLTCPTTAPSEWGTVNAPLESVRVLSFRTGANRDEDTALPIMAPVKEWQRAGVLYQTWNMNVDAPAFTYQVDCLFNGTARYVRLGVGSVKRCLAKQHLRSKTFTFRCD